MNLTPEQKATIDTQVAEMACKYCDTKTLRIEWRDEFEAKPLGTYSLAGAQMKASATKREWPWMVCSGCGRESKAVPVRPGSEN